MSASRVLRTAVLVGALAPLAACEWFTDFKRQPFVTTWESFRPDSAVFRGQPQGSVPTTGTHLAAWQVSYNPMPGVIDSIGAAVTNPTPVSDSSLRNGQKYYQINCAVCHGDDGAGQGGAVKYGMVPFSIVTDVTKNRSDGYIYGMIRNGRGLMPSYARIEEADRWDVVNYIRGLQGTLGREVPKGPVGAPGETGDKLPGATRLGPTRAVPHNATATSPSVPEGANVARSAKPAEKQ